MNSNSQDLQASHHIISLLERSKANAEAILDQLPDLVCVVNADGRVFKGNLVLASQLDSSAERVLKRELSSLFRSETWQVFQGQIQGLHEVGANATAALPDKRVEFELPV